MTTGDRSPTEPTHVYVGTDERGDVWQLYDASQDRVLEWAVAVGGDSRAMIAGTLRDLGPPSPYTIAQRPAGTGTPMPPPPSTNPPPPVITPPPPSNAMTVTRIYHPVTGHAIDIPTDAAGTLLWRYVGADSAGNPVFQLIDAAGTVKQFTIDGAGNVQNLINAQVIGVMVNTTPPPSTTQGGTLPPSTSSASTGSNNNTILIVAGLGFLAWLMTSN